MRNVYLAGILGVALGLPLFPQAQPPAGDVVEMENPPVFKAEVVSKTAQAVNYRYQSGSTRIDFVGTALMPRATGEAKVSSKKGRIEIDARFEGIGGATQFGAEYLTYAMWAITPEGRAVNLGEILLKNGRGKLKVTTDLQGFGLIVTAEPYFSVSQPSDLVVLQNEIRKGTKGKLHFINAKYELLKRGEYKKLSNPLALTLDLKKVPLELYEARNAVQIAKSVRADSWAEDIFSRAAAGLQMAENALKTGDKKLTAQHARQAVQTAEDARVVALKRQEKARIDKDQRDADLATRKAKEAAETAEAQRKSEAERRVSAEAARLKAEQEKMQAELEAARAAAQKAEADAARAAALLERQKAQEAAQLAEQNAAQARAAAQQAVLEKQQLRQKLLDLFNQVLDTRDTERGLVVNMSDVLFDVGKYKLRPLAREKLARISGIFMTYPGLKLECEGHTDSTGSLELNTKLSLNRAEAVREYLISQGIDSNRITAVGKGPTMPVADNATREGRQKNRRVEIIVSGDVIGTKIG